MRLLVAISLFALVSTAGLAEGTRLFDFGLVGQLVQAGAVAVEPGTTYNAERGFGWVGSPVLEARDRGLKDKLLRDFVYGRGTAEFRVDMPNGYYRVTIRTGDSEAGNHVLTVDAGGQEVVRGLAPPAREFVEYAFTTKVVDGSLDLKFSSPVGNWVLNGLEIAPAQGPG